MNEPEQGRLIGARDGLKQVCRNGIHCPTKTNNKDILLDIVQRLTRLEDGIIEIKRHTETMNEELGNCMKDITTCKEEINKVSTKFLVKLSWKQLTAVIGGTSTLVTILYTLLKIFVFKI